MWLFWLHVIVWSHDKDQVQVLVLCLSRSNMEVCALIEFSGVAVFTLMIVCSEHDCTENAKHLLKLPGADDRLQLIAADICTPNVFDSIFEGCDGVFHTSTPTPGAYDAASMSEVCPQQSFPTQSYSHPLFHSVLLFALTW